MVWKKTDISHMKVFGCVAYAHVPNTERKKLDKKASSSWDMQRMQKATDCGMRKKEKY